MILNRKEKKKKKKRKQVFLITHKTRVLQFITTHYFFTYLIFVNCFYCLYMWVNNLAFVVILVRFQLPLH